MSNYISNGSFDTCLDLHLRGIQAVGNHGGYNGLFNAFIKDGVVVKPLARLSGNQRWSISPYVKHQLDLMHQRKDWLVKIQYLAGFNIVDQKGVLKTEHLVPTVFMREWADLQSSLELPRNAGLQWWFVAGPTDFAPKEWREELQTHLKAINESLKDTVYKATMQTHKKPTSGELYR